MRSNSNPCSLILDFIGLYMNSQTDCHSTKTKVIYDRQKGWDIQNNKYISMGNFVI